MADDDKKPDATPVQIIGPNQVIKSSRDFNTPMPRRRPGGSLAGKVEELAQQMDEFTIETHVVLDGVSDKIKKAREKRDEAADVQHAHYDGLIDGFQDSIDAVERFSNVGPLEKDKKS